MSVDVQEPLPLRARTPPSWAAHAMSDPLALLCDHAHLERKAASNALDLLGRWPERVELRGGSGAATRTASDRWVRVLTSIAQDELRHLAQVLRHLTTRGGHLERAHHNPYAAALHARVRRGQGRQELVDRLLVSALIEVRSCERFECLAACEGDPELARFFASLCHSERGHYRAFLELAASLPEGDEDVEARWSSWLDVEAEVIHSQVPGPRIHSGGRADA